MNKSFLLLFTLLSLCVCRAFSQSGEFVRIDNDVFVKGDSTYYIKGAVLDEAFTSHSASKKYADSLIYRLDSLKSQGFNTVSVGIGAESLNNVKFLDSFDSFCFHAGEKGMMLFISLDSMFTTEQQIEQLMLRVNKRRKLAYKDDTSILAWSIPFSESIAQKIKQIDKNHLLTYQSEKLQDAVLSEAYHTAFSSPYVDFITIHLNPSKFGWVKNSAIQTDLIHSYSKTIQLLEKSLLYARKSLKPMVIESISFPEDASRISMQSDHICRDTYFEFIESYQKRNRAQGKKIAGLFFEYNY